MQWIEEVWKDKKAWEHWSIDNYDSKDTHLEWNLEVPRRYLEDREVTGTRFHRLRDELIQVETDIYEVCDKDEVRKQETKMSARNHIREILMKYYKEPLRLGERTTSNDNGLNCMWQNRRRKERRQDEEDEDDGDEIFICTMRGNDWEALPYPIIVDSGASASILPKEWCQHVKFWETDESKAGQPLNAANGQTIANLGRRSVTLMTREGAVRDMNFEVCSVTRALGSVSQMCRAGHLAIFNPPWDQNGSYIEHLESG